MMMRYWLSAALFLCACGSDVESDFSKSESMAIFDSSNSQIHELHLAAFELEELPVPYVWDCPTAGTITFEAVTDGSGGYQSLLHSFEGCVIDGRTLAGDLDYMNVEILECGGGMGFGYDIVGSLTVTGDDSGECLIDASERCGNFSGRTCGYGL